MFVVVDVLGVFDGVFDGGGVIIEKWWGCTTRHGLFFTPPSKGITKSSVGGGGVFSWKGPLFVFASSSYVSGQIFALVVLYWDWASSDVGNWTLSVDNGTASVLDWKYNT